MQNDVVYRRYLDPNHRAYIPDFGVFIRVPVGEKMELRAISRRLGNPRLGSRAAGGPSVRVGEGES